MGKELQNSDNLYSSAIEGSNACYGDEVMNPYIYTHIGVEMYPKQYNALPKHIHTDPCYRDVM